MEKKIKLKFLNFLKIQKKFIFSEIFKKFLNLEENKKFINFRRDFFNIFNNYLKEKKITKNKKTNIKKNIFKLNQNNCIFRFAPSPSGELHLGHSKIFFLNQFFKENNENSKYYLRFEDTNFSKINKNNYNKILKKLTELDISFDKIFYQSKRKKIYLKFLNKAIINNSSFFICFCSKEKIRENRLNKKKCLHYFSKKNNNLKKIKELTEGVVLMVNENYPKDKSFFLEVIYRKIELSKEYFFTMNFCVSIDDYLMKITHVIRGIDHEINTKKQIYIRKILKLKENIKFFHVGLVNFKKNKKFSSSNLEKNYGREFLSKKYIPNLRKFWKENGLSKSNSIINLERFKRLN